MTTTIPKSLHTVTVLVNVAQLAMRNTAIPATSAVRIALETLGYADTPDTYGLACKALTILHKEACRAAAADMDSFYDDGGDSAGHRREA